MAEWYETPYKTGRPVAVPGFPRPLYPPDAANKGKQPSVDGPDVEAYKRTVWRAGRWQGPASNFDRAFSNNFSHGKSPNVVDTGVAGVQRQQAVEPDTGWIGKSTFDILRSIKVPDGPHKGEMAMDANAQNLIAQAWKMFGGNEPKPEPPKPPPNVKTTRRKALDAAEKYIGVKESPAGSNHTKFGVWYGVDLQPWCAIFATYCYEVDAGGSPSFVRGNNYAYVPYIVQDARNNRNGLHVTSAPISGDLVCFDWGRDGTYDHVGMFDYWIDGPGGSFSSVEGNTSVGNNSNGGEVMRRTRRISEQNTVFVRVDEP